MEKDISLLQNNLKLKNDEILKLTQEKIEQNVVKSKFESELKICQKSREYFKSIYDELENRKTNEINLLEKELNNRNLAIKELKSRILIIERESEDIKEANNKLAKELELTKSDCNQMIKLLEENESKISVAEERENSLRLAQDNFKKRMEEALLVKEQFSVKEKQFQYMIQKIKQENTENLDERQKNYDSILKSIQTGHEALLSQKEKDIIAIQERFTTSEIECEKMKGEMESVKNQNKLLEADLNTIKKLFEKNFSESDELNKKLEEEKTDLEIMLKKFKNEYNEKWSLISKENENLKNTNQDIQDRFNDMKKTFDLQIDEANKIIKNKTKMDYDIDVMKRELEQAKMLLSQKLVEQDRNSKIIENLKADFQLRINENVNKEEKAKSLIKHQTELINKWKFEHDNKVAFYEKMLSDSKSKLNEMKAKYSMLITKLPEKEKDDLDNSLSREDPK